MHRAAVVVGLLLASSVEARALGFMQYHHYTVTFVKATDGSIRAEKEPGVLYFEIDYGFGTDWTFVNNTGIAIDVQFQESSARAMCHLRFIPTGSVFCESSVIQLAPGASDTLHADALDLNAWDYCWSYDPCPGELRVAPHGQVLTPVDPDLEIERDYLFAAVAAVAASLLSFLAAYALHRRRVKQLILQMGSRGAA